MTPSAKIIADSVSEEGARLTTMQVTGHRFILAEFNTHRVFSRNSASSRAIPLAKQIAKIEDDLVEPLVWAGEQKGMQGGDEIEVERRGMASGTWRLAAQAAITYAKDLGFGLDVHKSIANRLLEPFMAHTIVVSSTAWENFFLQRCSPLAQPEIRVLAEAMRDAYQDSTPVHMGKGAWHLPYVEPLDWEAISVLATSMQSPELDIEMTQIATKVSAARCARTSYLTQEGKRNIQADLDLYHGTPDKKGLISAMPPHWSPLEHVATPWPANRQRGQVWIPSGDQLLPVALNHLPRVGNLVGWRSLRTTVEAEKGAVTFR